MLGPVVVRAHGTVLPVDRPLEVALLVRLALARGAGVPDDRLGADLWPDVDPVARAARLRVLVSRLRGRLGTFADAVTRTAAGYRTTAEITDLRAARAAADRMHAAVRTGDAAAARTAAAQALACWRGPALADVRARPFAAAEADRLDTWHHELTVHRLQADIALGATAEILAELTELAAADPLHEPIWGLLATALYSTGRQADALDRLTALRRSLATVLGVDPSPATAELELRILRQDPALLPSRPPPGPSGRRDIVGRTAELAHLADHLDRARSDLPSVVLVEGEPGIGKTRLLEELEHLAGQHDLPVFWGRGNADGGAPAFWPWRQALRTWQSRTDPQTVAAALATADADLALIVPEFGTRRAGAQLSAEDRFALFDAAAAFLTAAAVAGSGLVLALDDLHWADTASLLLLDHIARHVDAAPLLIAASFRPVDLRRDQRAGEIVAELARLRATSRIELTGLTPAAVAQQLELVTGRPCTADEAASVAQRAGGNPLFVREIGRVIAAAGPEDGPVVSTQLPTAVRDAIMLRVAALSTTCRTTLSAAATPAADIDPVLLAAVLDRPVDDVMTDLDEATGAGLLDGRHRFVHDLVRDCLHAEVSRGDRARIHLRAAEHLASLHDATQLHRVTHHRLEALPLGDPALAAQAATASAEQALRQLAFEDAARLLERAATTITGIGAEQRGELLLGRARAELLAHDVAAALRSSEAAAALAEDAALPAVLARAALALQDVSDPAWLAKADRWSRHALAELPAGDGVLRAQLLAQLTIARTWSDEQHNATDTSAEALAMAERLADPAALYTALRARQLARSGPDGAEERLHLGDRMLAIAGAEPALWGRLWRFDALVQLGRVDAADAELDLLEPVVAAMRQPMATWHLARSRAALHCARGRFDAARTAAAQAIALVERGRHPSAGFPSQGARLAISLLTGDAAFDPELPEIERYHPPPRLLTLLTAEWHAVHGRIEESDRLYRQLPSPRSVPLKPFMHLLFHAISGTVAAAVGDFDGAAHAHAALLPYADQHATSGAGVSMTRGSVHLALGVTAATPDAAVHHLEAAAAANARAGLAPFAAEARCRLAEQLTRRAGHGDDVAAATAAAEAEAAAARLGMVWLRDRAARATTV